MKNLHLNNHISSPQKTEEFAMQVFTEILENKEGEFQISMDDGDGDVWITKITIESHRVESFTQIKEN